MRCILYVSDAPKIYYWPVLLHVSVAWAHNFCYFKMSSSEILSGTAGVTLQQTIPPLSPQRRPRHQWLLPYHYRRITASSPISSCRYLSKWPRTRTEQEDGPLQLRLLPLPLRRPWLGLHDPVRYIPHPPTTLNSSLLFLLPSRREEIHVHFTILTSSYTSQCFCIR